MKFKKTAITVCVAMGVSAGSTLHADQQKSGSPMAADSQSESRYLDSHSTTVGKLKGKEIVNAAGDEIGEVDNVVRGVSDKEEHAVVSVGGFLGIGDKLVTIPLKDMQLDENNLLAPIANTADELKTRKAFNDADFYTLHDEETVQIGYDKQITDKSQIAAEPASSNTSEMKDSENRRSRIGFGTLDLNRDGYLSKDEASGVGNVSVDWDQFDTNNDGRLDKAEFSALEEQGPSDLKNESMPSDDMRRETENSSERKSSY